MQRMWSHTAFNRLLEEKFKGRALRLARRVGVEASTALRWKNGSTPRGEHVGKIAEAFGVPEAALYEGGTEDESPPAEAARLMARLGKEDQAAALHLLRKMTTPSTPYEVTAEPILRAAAPAAPPYGQLAHRPGEPMRDLGAPTAESPSPPIPSVPAAKKRRPAQRPRRT